MSIREVKYLAQDIQQENGRVGAWARVFIILKSLPV